MSYQRLVIHINETENDIQRVFGIDRFHLFVRKDIASPFIIFPSRCGLPSNTIPPIMDPTNLRSCSENNPTTTAECPSILFSNKEILQAKP